MSHEVARSTFDHGDLLLLTYSTPQIRTPITAMMGISELLLDDATLQPEHRTLVEQCLRCGEM